MVNYPRKSARVHRLVAMAFVPNPEGHTEVNHIDGDKGNNHCDNLEWCSRLENMRHAFANGLCKAVSGENAPAAKLSEAEVQEIMISYFPRTSHGSCAALARKYGVDQSRIHQILVRGVG